jgi:hypothetical protein
VQTPVRVTLVTFENPPGVHTADERIGAFEGGASGLVEMCSRTWVPVADGSSEM